MLNQLPIYVPSTILFPLNHVIVDTDTPKGIDKQNDWKSQSNLLLATAYRLQCAAENKARKPSWEAAVSTWLNANTTFCVTTQTQQQVSMTPLLHKYHVSSVDFHFYCIKQDLSLLLLFIFKTCVCLLCSFRIHNLFQPSAELTDFKNLTAVRIYFLAEYHEVNVPTALDL